MKLTTRFMLVSAFMFTTTGFQSGTPLARSRPSQFAKAGYILRPIPFSAVHHHQVGFPRFRFWESVSGNWSGYAVPLDTSRQTDTFSDVQGTWTVPEVTGGRSTAYSSAWVGIDGYDDGTVEQIGTEQDWTGRAQENYVWFEMYPGGAYEIVNFPISPGNSFTGQVSYVGTSKGKSVFQLTITNVTKKVSYTVPASYTTISSAGRSSAEWIVEAPTSREILPLADFTGVDFSSCEAASVLSGGKLAPIDSWIPDPLTMLDPSGGASLPSVLSTNGEAFFVVWSDE